MNRTLTINLPIGCDEFLANRVIRDALAAHPNEDNSLECGIAAALVKNLDDTMYTYEGTL